MAWQRKIPFGYVVQNGEIAINHDEATVVQTIYAMYRSGCSYSRIAAEMERQGICYHAHTPQWNKNMVKRILENPRYLGQHGFPPLVSEEDSRAVRRHRAKKTRYAPCPVSIPPIRKKAVCGLCGGRMARDTKNLHPRWLCQNPQCGHRSNIKDDELQKQVELRLQKLAHSSHLLARAPNLPQCALSPEVRRLQNELTHALNRGDVDMEYMKAMIFAAAAGQYSSISDPTPFHRLEQLRERLEQSPSDADNLKELFHTFVGAVLITDHQIALQLIDGTIVREADGKEQAV